MTLKAVAVLAVSLRRDDLDLAGCRPIGDLHLYRCGRVFGDGTLHPVERDFGCSRQVRTFDGDGRPYRSTGGVNFVIVGGVGGGPGSVAIWVTVSTSFDTQTLVPSDEMPNPRLSPVGCTRRRHR